MAGPLPRRATLVPVCPQDPLWTASGPGPRLAHEHEPHVGGMTALAVFCVRRAGLARLCEVAWRTTLRGVFTFLDYKRMRLLASDLYRPGHAPGHSTQRAYVCDTSLRRSIPPQPPLASRRPPQDIASASRRRCRGSTSAAVRLDPHAAGFVHAALIALCPLIRKSARCPTNHGAPQRTPTYTRTPYRHAASADMRLSLRRSASCSRVAGAVVV